MNSDEQAQFLKATAIWIKEQVDKAVEARLAEFKFLGSWVDGRTYKRHNTCALGGSTWICTADATTVRPSTDEPLHWQIVAKRGRDGQDGTRSPTKPRSSHG